MKRTGQVKRNPFVMVVAGVIWLTGAVVATLGVMNFGTFGWWAVPLVAGGVSSMFFASATVITGKSEWILLDLILPG